MARPVEIRAGGGDRVVVGDLVAAVDNDEATARRCLSDTSFLNQGFFSALNQMLEFPRRSGNRERGLTWHSVTSFSTDSARIACSPTTSHATWGRRSADPPAARSMCR